MCRSGASRSVVEEVIPDGLQFGSRGGRACSITVRDLTYNYGVAEMLIKHVLLVRCAKLLPLIIAAVNEAISY